MQSDSLIEERFKTPHSLHLGIYVLNGFHMWFFFVSYGYGSNRTKEINGNNKHQMRCDVVQARCECMNRAEVKY